VRRILVLAAVVLVAACGTTTSGVPATTPPPSSPAPSPSPAPSCDPSLWSHVYHPQRLHVIQPCVTVTGTIEAERHEPDGDLHILLKPDPVYASLLNQVNITAQHGDLVLEPVCVSNVTQADAEAACTAYASTIPIPPVGARVAVTGTYVLDTAHGWDEVHPVSSLMVLVP
jgi:hypothetical protein